MKFTGEQAELLIRARTGHLTDTDIMFYDISFDRYVYQNLRTKKLSFYKEKAAIKKSYELVNYLVKGKHIVEELPVYICVFDPTKSGGFYEEHGEKYFNFFEEPEAFALKRASEHKSNNITFLKKYKYFNILLKNLLVKEDYLEYFVNWLSVIINERIKTRTAIIFKGIEGTGKGVLWDQLITPLFSDKYTVTVENEGLRSQFNGQLENKLFVLFNEIKGDFRESATLYEKLKIYISDSEISINNKYGGAGKSSNFFNSIFFSNNSLPVQISPRDRRYTVFNTGNTTLTQICESLGITTDDFIAGLKQERDSFIKDLFAYDYNISRACNTMVTEEKTIISESTTPKLQLISAKLKEQDFNWLYERGVETIETMKFDIEGAQEAIINDLEQKFFYFLENHLTQGFISNIDLVTLYRLFVNFEETSSIKIANAWTPNLGKSQLKKLNGKALRIRVVGKIKEWSIESYIQENLDKEDIEHNLSPESHFDDHLLREEIRKEIESRKVVEDKDTLAKKESSVEKEPIASMSVEEYIANYEYSKALEEIFPLEGDKEEIIVSNNNPIDSLDQAIEAIYG